MRKELGENTGYLQQEIAINKHEGQSLQHGNEHRTIVRKWNTDSHEQRGPGKQTNGEEEDHEIVNRTQTNRRQI